MSEIFVFTENCDLMNKTYDASKAGKGAAAAEMAIHRVVRRIINKECGFTTNTVDKPKGYVIRFKITKFEIVGRDTKCTLTGEIVRYPTGVNHRGEKGEFMVSTRNWSGDATASGTSERSLFDCVEAIAESMVPKSIPAMRLDFKNW